MVECMPLHLPAGPFGMPYAELYKRDCSRPWGPRGFRRGVAGCYGSRCLRDWQSRFPMYKNQHQAWRPYTRPIPKAVSPAGVAAKFRASPPCSLDCHIGNHSRFPIPWQTRACIRKFEAVGNSTSVLYCQEISTCPTTFGVRVVPWGLCPKAAAQRGRGIRMY